MSILSYYTTSRNYEKPPPSCTGRKVVSPVVYHENASVSRALFIFDLYSVKNAVVVREIGAELRSTGRQACLKMQ